MASGQGVVTTAAGGGQVSGTVSVSGAVKISGENVVVTSATVTVDNPITGVQVSGTVGVSGTVITSMSGNIVSISGEIDIVTPTAAVMDTVLLFEGGSGTPLTSNVGSLFMVKALTSNAGLVYLGTPGTLPYSGFVLAPGEIIPINIDEIGRVWGQASTGNSGDAISYIGT
jgi:hypothetical protein